MTSHDEKQLGDHDTKVDLSQSDEVEDIIRNTTVAGEISEYAVVAEGEERTTWFIWVLIACSSISGLLFGVFLVAPFHLVRRLRLGNWARIRHWCDFWCSRLYWL